MKLTVVGSGSSEPWKMLLRSMQQYCKRRGVRDGRQGSFGKW